MIKRVFLSSSCFALALRSTVRTSRLLSLSVLLFALTATCSTVFAIPEYALLTGNRCINCHINAQGGGLRNDLGFYSTEGVSLIKPEWVGLEGIISEVFGTNCAIDRKLFYGLDFRLMSARSAVTPITAPSPERKLFPMQASIQGSYHPTSWVFGELQYNFGRAVYQGQKSWSASVNVQPELTLPSLRVGFFQPSIGLNYDDHTMLVHQIAGTYPRPLIAPYYSEWGAEVRYSAPLWLDVSAGVFDSKSLSEVYTDDSTAALRSIIHDSKPLLNARFALTPRFYDEKLNVTIGASVVSAGDFSMINVFGGAGWQDKVCLMAEFMMQGNKDARQIRCISSEVMGKIFEPVYLFVRAEYGANDNVIKGTSVSSYTKQFVFGSKLILFPFIELHPEYRIIDTEEFYRTRWMVQLHVFY